MAKATAHTPLVKGSRITGDQRTTLAAELGKRYASGDSIRTIAEDTGRSFGFVHGLLKESGADLRGRGGATRGARAGDGTPSTSGGTAPAKKAAAKKPAAKKSPKKASAKTS